MTQSDKRLVLDVRHVRFSGTPKGLDGQALAWVPPHKLASYPMPPADRPVVAALLQPDRYLVTPAPGDDDGAWLASLRQALARGGLRRVQLRAPGLDPARWSRLAMQASALCREAGIECLLNGEIALAERLQLGVHLRAAQLHEPGIAAALDALKSRGGLLGASCHGIEDLLRAEMLGCAFAVLGPVQATPTHPDATGIGWDAFAGLRERVSLPIYAIGGLGMGDVEAARAHGAQGIAAIRALWA